MAHHRAVAAVVGQRDGVQRLGQRADLIHLDQQRICDALLDTLFQAFGIGDEDVVADELHPVADRRGQRRPAVPIIFGQRVFDGHQRIRAEQPGVELGHLLGGAGAALELVAGAVAVELGGRRVEGQRHVGAEFEAGRFDGPADQVQRRGGARHVGGEAALVAQAGAQALLLQHRLQRVIHLRTPAQRLGETRRADRGDHELLDVDGGVGVRAAVEDVHHRHRQDVRVGPAQVAEQRQLRGIGGRLGHGQRHAQDRVAAQPRLVRGAVQVDQRLVHQALVVGVQPDHRRADLVQHGLHRLLHALAAVPLPAVAQFDGLVLTGRRPGRHRRAGERSVGQGDLDLDCRVTAGVEDLAGPDLLDNRH
ncbi:hypothetical protein PICSAR164_02797 [Mycobacterium avium subsp. paratuberculosis]|nr:hypothetical protein PICSAR164_02797 [Mycobacterium avium subsp. paratuberculosis]